MSECVVCGGTEKVRCAACAGKGSAGKSCARCRGMGWIECVCKRVGKAQISHAGKRRKQMVDN